MTSPATPDIRVVLFDFDDTLVATKQAKWTQHQYIARTHYGLDLTDADITAHWGKPQPALVQLLYRTDDVDTAIGHNKREHHRFPKLEIPGASAALAKLCADGYPLGVVTAGMRWVMDTDLPRLGWSELFHYQQTADDSTHHKPDPEVFTPALSWLATQGFAAANTLYVGDGIHDYQAAQGAGLHFLGVTTGLTSAAEFAKNGAHAVADITEVPAWLGR